MPFKKKKILLFITFLIVTFFFANSTLAENEEEALLKRNCNGFLTEQGYKLYGEIHNNASYPITDVVLTANFHLKSGEKFSKNETTSLIYIPADRKSPFIIWITNRTLSNEIENFTIQIGAYNRAEIVVSPQLEIVKHAATNDSVGAWIRNNGAEIARFVTVLVTFYDKDNKILDVSSPTRIPGDSGQMEPGSSEFIRVQFSNKERVKDVEWYSITASALLPTNPHYVVKNEVNFAPFTEDQGTAPIVSIFILLVVFSAAVLAGAYVFVKIKQRKKRSK